MEGGRYDYFGPDASVLLSDSFLDTHCFRFHEPGISRACRPVFRACPGREAAGHRGHSLAGSDYGPAQTPGVFLRLGTLGAGRWCGRGSGGVPGASEWRLGHPSVVWIRMPTLSLQFPAGEGGQPARLIGTLEVGWEVKEISTLDRQVVGPQALGRVRGKAPRDGVRIVRSRASAWSCREAHTLRSRGRMEASRWKGWPREGTRFPP